MRGLVDDAELERELSRATVGLVTQRDDVTEFNVRPTHDVHGAGYSGGRERRTGSEVARIMERSGGDG